MRALTAVLTSAESQALDLRTIGGGTPSRALMGRAGAAAAAEIALRYPDALKRGVLVLAGPGNNGGDGWVVARAFAAAGIDLRILSPIGSHSPDCVAEAAATSLALSGAWNAESAYTGEGVVVDALLGTGSEGPVRGEIVAAVKVIERARNRGAVIVSLDLPSGLDGTTGDANGAARADLTISFGNVKRGHVVARGLCGDIVVVDIGLVSHPERSEGSFASLRMTDARWVHDHIPPIDAEAHKGTRKKLLFVGGGPGMAGAAILGLRSALASGIGMVKASVHADSVNAIHGAVPATLISAWPDAKDKTPDDWPDVVVIGPGLGRGPDARRIVESVAAKHSGPMLLDADALTAFENNLKGLGALVGKRQVLITPHVVELGRLIGEYPETVLARRFEIGAEVARKTGMTVLLKGVPTIVSRPDGRVMVVAAGTPVLATGGSGDLLSGIAGTLLAQTGDALTAGVIGAWIHGRAAELAGAHVRGTTLDDVLAMLPNAWRIDASPLRYPVIAELPAVGGA